MLRASVNRYVDVEVLNVAKHTVGSQVSQRCRWNTVTEQFDSNCEYSGGASKNTVGTPCGPTGVDEEGNDCFETLRIPHTMEYTMGAEREVAHGVALTADLIHRSYRDQYEKRETNRIWEGSGELLERTGGYRNGRNETISDLGTPANAGRIYTGLTVGVRQREGRLKTRATYTLARLEGNTLDTLDNAFLDIPPRDIYLYGALGDDRRHEIKAQLQYEVTSWFSTGVRYAYYSGLPYDRRFRNDVTGNFDSYRSIRGINPGANINDPGDDRPLRTPDQHSFNAQFRVNLAPLIRHRLAFYVDVLNLMALRTETAFEQNDGPAFGRPTGTRMDPLRIRLGLNYKY